MPQPHGQCTPQPWASVCRRRDVFPSELCCNGFLRPSLLHIEPKDALHQGRFAGVHLVSGSLHGVPHIGVDQVRDIYELASGILVPGASAIAGAFCHRGGVGVKPIAGSVPDLSRAHRYAVLTTPALCRWRLRAGGCDHQGEPLTVSGVVACPVASSCCMRYFSVSATKLQCRFAKKVAYR